MSATGSGGRGHQCTRDTREGTQSPQFYTTEVPSGWSVEIAKGVDVFVIQWKGGA